jgi:hypothetical protein
MNILFSFFSYEDRETRGIDGGTRRRAATGPVRAAVMATALFMLGAMPAAAAPYPGQVNADVKRDRILAISQDYTSLYWYCGPENIDYSGYTGATCPDPTVGWKTGMKYCWGGRDSTAQYLSRIAAGAGAGNKWTSSGTTYDTYCAGADCSGMASNCWTSARYTTSGFPSISNDILWENLRAGDCTNLAGSHIRIFDYYVSAIGTLMFYESTSGSGLLWKAVHRSLARDTNYTPIRYNNPSGYKVYDYPEPTITYLRKNGIERAELRWDGQADIGFRLYQSTNGTDWTLLRTETQLTPLMRTCSVSGLTPDVTYYYKMTSLNSGGETIESPVAAFRIDGFASRVLLVDGADRYRQQKSANHAFFARVGAAVAATGAGFDFCANEGVVDEQVNLGDYQAVVWILAEESTFDETFSWAEQMHVMNYLQSGGRLFVSGSEIGWDLDNKANDTTWKNGSPNDRPFSHQYLRAGYVADDAGTYRVTGDPGTLFAGLDFYFDNGTQGTYDVAYPDVLAAKTEYGAVAGMTYQGGIGGTACVYGSSPTTGTVVNMGFGFETIYPESARTDVMRAVVNYFDIPVVAPTLKSVVQTAPDAVTITWDGHGSLGFRLEQKTGNGTWTPIRNESVLGPTARGVVVSGLTPGARHAFKMQAVNSDGASSDSDVLCAQLGTSGLRILVVDGYDRWNAQSSGANHTLVENFADALSAHAVRYDSCTNETIVEGAVALSSYDVVMWMCGEESTESETFSAAEQARVEAYLEGGGRLFVSGAEIGWDLVYKADTANDFSNGSPNDTPFYRDFLKADFAADDANTYNVTGVAGSIFAGLSFSFDDGTHGTYDANYPDVIVTYGGSENALYYNSGPQVAGIVYSGTFGSGSVPGKLVHFGFPFETIYEFSARSAVMERILTYFTDSSSRVNGWKVR